MRIDTDCKLAALRGVYESMAVTPGAGLLYVELQQLWKRTGLRGSDLHDALATAILSGELRDHVSDEGRMALLSRSFTNPGGASVGAGQDWQLTHIAAALAWARERARSGARSGRRFSDRSDMH